MKIRALFFALAILGFCAAANAQELSQDSISSVTSAYRFYKDVDAISVVVPTVAEVAFADEFIERFDFAVLDKTANSFEPYFFRQERFVNQIPISVRANSGLSVADYLV